jgi:hypothetical protein
MLTPNQISDIMKNYLIKSNVLFKKEIGLNLTSKKIVGIENYFSTIVSTMDIETRKLIKLK